MRRVPLLIASALFAASIQAATVAVLPSAPNSLDTVVVHVDIRDLPFHWAAPDVTMSANKLTLTVHDTVAQLEGPYPNLDWPIGQLPTGNYQVEVVAQFTGGAQLSIGTTTFQVAPRPSSAPKANYSDMWWVPSESGWGLSIQQHSSNIMFIAWFVYGADRNPTWYVVPNGQWDTDRQYSGTVYKTTGPYFGAPFDPGAVSVQAAGRFKLFFLSYDTATLQYSIDGVSVEKSLVRQGF